jgi:D-arginine dehydrogenase
MTSFDVLVIGGGIAGLSAAAALSTHARVIVLEAEAAPGYHSSGRSATFYHLGIGDRTVRALTTFSRPFFEQTSDQGAPLSTPKSALWIARSDMIDGLNTLYDGMRMFSDQVHHVGVPEMLDLLPVLRTGPDAVIAGVVDETGRKLDADALQQGFARTLRRNGGQIETGVRVDSITREHGAWLLQSGDKAWRAGVVVNAAGAWADQVARLAGVKPLGLSPLRRTIISFDPPENIDTRDWPFVKTTVDEFYMLPEGGRLLASPVDEIPSDPVDAQPEEYDIALAAYRVEEYTTMNVSRIAHRWAGLRSFVKDRVPTAGFAPDAPGFFWLAGQGGYGLQTSPAMAAASAALILQQEWPAALAELGVAPEHISPGRPAIAS